MFPKRFRDLTTKQEGMFLVSHHGDYIILDADDPISAMFRGEKRTYLYGFKSANINHIEFMCSECGKWNPPRQKVCCIYCRAKLK